MVVCVRFAPNGRASVKPKKESVKVVLAAIYQNKPLLIFLGGVFLFSFAIGMHIGLTFFFVDGYLGLGKQFPLIYTISLVMGVLGALAVYRLPRRMENKHVYALSLILGAVGMAGLSMLEPGDNIIIPVMFFLSLISFSNAMTQIALASLLSDVADYGCWKFKADRAATYFAVYQFSLKSFTALGISLAIAVVDSYGFDTLAATQNDTGGLAVRLLVGIVPAVILSSALFFAVKMPINAWRHRIIKKRISSRLRRQANQNLSDSLSSVSLCRQPTSACSTTT